eukprot:TRINITY_DN6652_c0_g1_i4.p1 TRINITY_DN6652_c0_g1~~TRINITY_DN6652_c0_g1_i4.p1  ORF type:complete len:634 (+),score=167.33 TRINITY_DN6652_c0_g1_i4:88-1989(+)
MGCGASAAPPPEPDVPEIDADASDDEANTESVTTKPSSPLTPQPAVPESPVTSPTAKTQTGPREVTASFDADEEETTADTIDLALAFKDEPPAMDLQQTPAADGQQASTCHDAAVMDEDAVTPLSPEQACSVEPVHMSRQASFEEEVEEVRRELEASVEAEKQRLSALEPDDSIWCRYGGRDLEPLLTVTTLVDLQWLARLARHEVLPERKGVSPGWSQLPLEAQVSASQLQASGSVPQGQLPIVVFSCPWASEEHPDPDGSQLQRLLPLLEVIEDSFIAPEPKPQTWGVFWDYMSMPQRTSRSRSEASAEKLARCDLATAQVHRWFAHPFTLSVLQDAPLCDLYGGSRRCRPYYERGWCLFERQLSGLVKRGQNMLSLSTPGYCRYIQTKLVDDWPTLVEHCGAVGGGRPPPVAPDRFYQRLSEGAAAEAREEGNGLFFFFDDDLDAIVNPDYRQAFLDAFSKVQLLDYSYLSWNDADVEDLVDALQYARGRGALSELRELWLMGNSFTERGFRTLANALQDGLFDGLHKLVFQAPAAATAGQPEPPRRQCEVSPSCQKLLVDALLAWKAMSPSCGLELCLPKEAPAALVQDMRGMERASPGEELEATRSFVKEHLLIDEDDDTEAGEDEWC